MKEAPTASPGFAECENERVHTPGAIQPFGVLLALDPNSLTVCHASENSREVFGPGTSGPLGATAAQLLGSVADKALREALASAEPSNPRPIPISIPGTEVGRWHAVAHYLGGMVLVELEAADDRTTPSVNLLAAVRSAAGQLAAAANISEFCATTAREVRSLTGYDRVMVYRFDAEWNGEVVAEERRADLEPFFGLHYPASDIPAQARALFRVNRIRVIPDAAAEPVAMTSDRDGSPELPLDMSLCLLRSASPIHREYLHNMGVRASLTASLVIGGRLWGLIACHHSTLKRPGPAEREACDLLARMASAHLALLVEAEDRGHLTKLAEALGKTAARLGAVSPPIAALTKDPADLLALVGATGAVVWRSGREIPIGQTPPPDALSGLLGWIRGGGAPIIATDRLSQVYEPAKPFADVASGLLALEVSRDTDEYVLWFRPEVLQSVNWGGDPHGKTGANGRLSPRRSFALWKETVRERSLPWRPAEVENAKRIKELLQAAASRSVVQLEALLPMCAWCKKVRDEPDYWRGVEEFIRDLVDVRFTHGICPACLDKQLGEFSGQIAAARPSA